MDFCQVYYYEEKENIPKNCKIEYFIPETLKYSIEEKENKNFIVSMSKIEKYLDEIKGIILRCISSYNEDVESFYNMDFPSVLFSKNYEIYNIYNIPKSVKEIIKSYNNMAVSEKLGVDNYIEPLEK